MSNWIQKDSKLVLTNNEDIQIFFDKDKALFFLCKGNPEATMWYSALSEAKCAGERFARDREEFA